LYASSNANIAFGIPRQSFGNSSFLIEASGGTVATDGRIIEMT
jgi:hypothetical protein